MKTHTELRAAQAAAGLSDAQCAELVGVTPLTWKRWLGKTSRPTVIDFRGWELFLLKTGRHPEFDLRKRVDGFPQTSEMIRAFLGSNISGVHFGKEGEEPPEDDARLLF